MARQLSAIHPGAAPVRWLGDQRARVVRDRHLQKVGEAVTPDPSGAARAPQPIAELLAEVKVGLKREVVPESDEETGAPFWFCHWCGEAADTKEAIRHSEGCYASWLGALVQAVEDLREKLGRANEQNRYCHDNHSPGQQMVIESQTQQLHDLRAEVAQLRADGQRLEERVKTARKFVLSAVGNLAEQKWEMCENELGAVLAALTTSDLGGGAP